jgi:hypothetical protein
MAFKIKSYNYTCGCCGQKFKADMLLTNPDSYCPNCNGLLENLVNATVKDTFVGSTVVDVEVYDGELTSITVLDNDGNINTFYLDDDWW